MADRYWNKPCFEAVGLIQEVAKRYDLTLVECTYRWLAQNSVLDGGKGDALLIGASRPAQLESNLVELEKGPLPEDVVQAIEKAWQGIE